MDRFVTAFGFGFAAFIVCIFVLLTGGMLWPKALAIATGFGIGVSLFLPR